MAGLIDPKSSENGHFFCMMILVVYTHGAWDYSSGIIAVFLVQISFRVKKDMS